MDIAICKNLIDGCRPGTAPIGKFGGCIRNHVADVNHPRTIVAAQVLSVYATYSPRTENRNSDHCPLRSLDAFPTPYRNVTPVGSWVSISHWIRTYFSYLYFLQKFCSILARSQLLSWQQAILGE